MVQAALQKKLEPDKFGFQEEGHVNLEQYLTCKELLAALQRDHEKLVANVQNQNLKINVLEMESDT